MRFSLPANIKRTLQNLKAVVGAKYFVERDRLVSIRRAPSILKGGPAIYTQLFYARAVSLRGIVLYLRSTTSKYFEWSCISYVGSVSSIIDDTAPNFRGSTSTVVDVNRVNAPSDCWGGCLRWIAIGFFPRGRIMEF